MSRLREGDQTTYVRSILHSKCNDATTTEAFFDTGAKCGVASQSLYFLLEKKGHVFEKQSMEVALADGNALIQGVKVARMEIELRGRRLWTIFVVLPEGKDTRTLLGVDFIEDAGLILNVPPRTRHFVDVPKQLHNFQGEVPVGNAPFGKRETGVPLSSLKADLIREIQEFAKRPPGCLSPIHEYTQGLQAFLREETEVEEPMSNALWPNIDSLFERCIRKFEMRMNISTIDIGEIRKDEAKHHRQRRLSIE
ncbi:uncharacterized protein LOC143362096 [Halictus rubicundus]|uniref:uncharacterized protein LOC143362096 n=1 Tax=Halictus rubicundus TaxID=77578 RepID=UPI004037249B